MTQRAVEGDNLRGWRKASILRLYRYGSPTSRTSEKMVEAARSIADRIAACVGVEALLPDGYSCHWGDESGRWVLIDDEGFAIDQHADRNVCAIFADQIAAGWLDRLLARATPFANPGGLQELQAVLAEEAAKVAVGAS